MGSIEILRLINATSEPYSGAFCEFESKKLIIWDAMIVDDNENFLAVPGQVTLIADKYVEIACGSGKLRLNQVEIESFRENPRKSLSLSASRLK